MKIAISGASGFVGSHLTRFFDSKNIQSVALNTADFKLTDEEFCEKIAGCYAVINLAGAPIIAKWGDEYKKVLRSSRIDTTKKIVDCIKKLSLSPKILISTSAVGIYSSLGQHDEENFVYADDFLSELCKEWEAEAFKAKEFGVRTIIFRFGIVIGAGGGALAKMLPIFKFGLGGPIGDGSQSFSWIHIDDLVAAMFFALNDESASGVYNMTAPNPTTNKGLTKALSHALHRPAFLPVPPFALRLLYGEGAVALTSGQSALPKRLLQSGFHFKYQHIDEAVQSVI